MALYYPYAEDMYYTTNVHKSFPEHHYPLEHTRHAVGNFFKTWDDVQAPHVPKADIRETTEKFYIDVELPGMENTGQLNLKWTNSRTLLLDAHCTRPPLPVADLPAAVEVHDKDNKPAQADDKDSKPAGANGSVADGDKNDGAKGRESANVVHITLHERWQGRIFRAFAFPVDVQHDALKAHLRAGLLIMSIPKVESSKVVQSKVVVG